MSPFDIFLLIGIIVGLYKIRDWVGMHAQHKRVIASKCSCGSCHAKKMEGKDKH